MERCNAWRRQAQWYQAKSDATSDPVLREQYSALALLCQDLAVAHESPIAGDASIEFDAGYAQVPLQSIVSGKTIH
jgi:hypothetical protein